jgi:hypothetical protein
MISPDQGWHANHYTTDVVSSLWNRLTNDCDEGVFGVVTNDANVLDGVDDTGLEVAGGGLTSPWAWVVLVSSADI